MLPLSAYPARRSSLLLAALAGALLLSGCGASRATRRVYHGFRPAEAQDLACVRPVVTMGLIVRGDDAHPDAWFSSHMAGRFRRSLQRQAGALHLQPGPAADDSLRRDLLRAEVERAAATLARQRTAEGYAEPLPVVESVLANQPGRYALLLVCRGFVRTKDNYQQESSQHGHQYAMFGVVGAGAAPQPNRLGLYALVYDREQHRVVYYGHRRSSSGQLLKDRVLDRRVRQLLFPNFGTPTAAR